MKKILQFIEKFLGSKAWAGISVLLTVLTLLFFSNKEPLSINNRISLIELDKNISREIKIQNLNWIKKEDDITIVKNNFKNNSFTFSLRNNLDYEILINRAKMNLYTIYGSCYQPTPIKYKVNFTLQESKYEINGTILSNTELEFEWDEIIRPKEVEIYKLLLDNLVFDKDSCVNYFLVNLDFIYDNKYIVSTPLIRIKNNEF